MYECMYVQCLNFNIMNRVFDVAYGKKKYYSFNTDINTFNLKLSSQTTSDMFCKTLSDLVEIS